MLESKYEDILDLLDNDGKILYILKIFGPLRFEEIVSLLNPYERISKALKNHYNEEFSKEFYKARWKHRKSFSLSRGTISKHLKSLKAPEKNLITQISVFDPITERNYLKYDLTIRGRAYISKIIHDDENLVDPELLGLIYTNITEFFRSRGLDSELHLPRIINMISRINQAEFFKIPQTEEFFYMLFYIYQNSLEFSIKSETLFYMDLENFSETYKVSKIQIQAQLEKFLNADVGYFRVKWNDTDLFFHVNDLFGSLLTTMVKNSIEAEIIKKALDLTNLKTFDALAMEITEKLYSLGFIHKNLKPGMVFFVLCYLILLAQERGLSRVDIVDLYPRLNLLNKDKKGVEYAKSIFFNVKDRNISLFRQLESIEKGIYYLIELERNKQGR